MSFSLFSPLQNGPSRLFLIQNFSTQRLIRLDRLQKIPEAWKIRKRVGRGTGSGLGKLSGYGHQHSRVTPLGFEGGQTPIYKLFPKIGFHNYTQRDLVGVNLDTIQEYIDAGRLIPKDDFFLTMRDIWASGLVTHYGDGIKLLSRGKSSFKTPIHFEVSFASEHAIRAVEAVGGTVTCVHFNELALRALMKPYKFDILPQRARPSPKIIDYYLDASKCGYLSPEIQLRNIQKFGFVTSEEKFREEHAAYMNGKRKEGLVKTHPLQLTSSA